MITANNGILIVVLLMWFGVSVNDKWLIASAFAAAGISYLANMADDWAEQYKFLGDPNAELAVAASTLLKNVTIVLVVVTYGYAAYRLFLI